MNELKILTFYLPQFHPIPENDKWWGRGFTEWTNVTRSKPKFKGHYQPHLPADLGFYDLRLPDIQHQQSKLASQYGIDGFIYYHYWFNGKRILNQPIDLLINENKPNFPFCLCWANENWTRRWDGLDQDVLLGQNYSHPDDKNHIHFLLKFFESEQYLKINNCPVFCVYRTDLLPNPEKTAEIWRQEVEKAGHPGLYLIRIENISSRINPATIGFDAAIEFAPDMLKRPIPKYGGRRYQLLNKIGITEKGLIENRLYEYSEMVQIMLQKKWPDYKWFRGATPSWDNSARRKHDASIYINNSPEQFQYWLSEIIKDTVNKYDPVEQIIVINAWNEWAEGCHLEPDQKFGLSWLEAVLKARSNFK